MNRRQAIKTAFSATAVATVLRPWMLAAQEAPPKPAVVEGTTVNVDPATGADTNSGTKESPLRTLAEAARRVNQADGTGPMTVILSEGVYAVGETATFKPERRRFTKTDRLTIRAEGGAGQRGGGQRWGLRHAQRRRHVRPSVREPGRRRRHRTDRALVLRDAPH